MIAGFFWSLSFSSFFFSIQNNEIIIKSLEITLKHIERKIVIGDNKPLVGDSFPNPLKMSLTQHVCPFWKH